MPAVGEVWEYTVLIPMLKGQQRTIIRKYFEGDRHIGWMFDNGFWASNAEFENGFLKLVSENNQENYRLSIVKYAKL